MWFDTFTTKDKILAALCDCPDGPAREKISFLCSRFPWLSREDITNTLWLLDREKFIRAVGTGREINQLVVYPFALSYLRDKRENRLTLMKWDLLKIGLGFVLGLISGYFLAK